MSEPVYPRPDRRLVLAEGPRLLAEMASLVPAAPFLAQAPRGDGHPVLVMPGFGGSDTSTQLLRRFLNGLGHSAEPWNLGRNLGPGRPELIAQLPERLRELYEASGSRKVSLVGWSLGGVYGRLLAHLHPDMVRQVVTLGSPFAGSPRSTTVYPIARRLMDRPVEQMPVNELRLLAGQPLPGVPSTAVFSKTDGVVPWQIASQQPTEIADNVEVFGSHVGLGYNPAVLYCVADRLSHPENGWQPFQRSGWKGAVYGAARLEAAAA